MASLGYALAQDAASQIKLFQGEYWYDTTQGIPYFQEILGIGQTPPINLMKSQFVAAALQVPGVEVAVCFISSIENGQVSGQVQISDSSDNVSIANF